ncbi:MULTISPECIES: helix-turn-helix transcriptional regulator [unclassified Coleofasciculus]|uniref:helix-turn-helix transcriptional regulator n=1 Tax=unclassified Coleofasciculus TaxID=2692782 RepID=UPI00187FD17F|nr:MULTISPECIES: helix-turn-helix transcriptional regulator [unclassified Coleofasciculus]MBE9125633.1 helix-turn-helix transcriptional regulator [Coleofasciculus sp. LEGE 07081]MBE9148787.1 helix-turn-helix transcriptional regulator [Coleofasciculus sp. LEGE 07092]
MADSNERKSELRLLREAAELTRAELGRRIGVSERQIYDWENGIKLPRIDRAVALARELGVSLQTVCSAIGIDVTGVPDKET